MKKSVPHTIEAFRVRTGSLGSDSSYGMNGAFIIPNGINILFVLVSDGGGYDHVSVSTPYRTPTWDEMCMVKNMFFDEEETVVQFHPKKSEYINHHPYVLHLWKKQGEEYQLPPGIMIGPSKE